MQPHHVQYALKWCCEPDEGSHFCYLLIVGDSALLQYVLDMIILIPFVYDTLHKCRRLLAKHGPDTWFFDACQQCGYFKSRTHLVN
eukprot:m.779310 g.779310  ORF g.779310 m.779310 type:complete len:86 (-) comp23278_c0_seq14:2360-2617(-)